MKKLKTFILLIFIFSSLFTYGQITNAKQDYVDTTNTSFRDTVFNFVFDSIFHSLGRIDSANGGSKIVKYFKYIGETPIIIAGTIRSGEPSHICAYPHGTLLIPNKLYSITFCIHHSGRQGKMTKSFGFTLSDGKTIYITFTANYLPLEKQDE